MSGFLLCEQCIMWNGMASEREKRADGFQRIGGRLSPVCASHSRVEKTLPFVPLHEGTDEYLVQGVMEA